MFTISWLLDIYRLKLVKVLLDRPNTSFTQSLYFLSPKEHWTITNREHTAGGALLHSLADPHPRANLYAAALPSLKLQTTKRLSIRNVYHYKTFITTKRLSLRKRLSLQDVYHTSTLIIDGHEDTHIVKTVSTATRLYNRSVCIHEIHINTTLQPLPFPR